MNKPSSRPANFIFILSDTHRYDAMSFTNPVKDHFEIYTPNMERMAKDGVSFKKLLYESAHLFASKGDLSNGAMALSMGRNCKSYGFE